MSTSTESISKGIDISLKNLVLFVPALVPIAVHLFFLVLAYVVFPYRVSSVWAWGVAPNQWLVLGGFFMSILVGFGAVLLTVDMANDVIHQQVPSVSKSLNVVTGRLGELVVAALIAAICAFTVILIPVALFIVTIAVVDKVDAVESVKRAIDFVINNIGEVLIFIIIVIVFSIIFGFAFALIPFVGAYLGAIIQWLLTVVFTVSAVCFYAALKQAPQAPLPPPPPPPPPPA